MDADGEIVNEIESTIEAWRNTEIGTMELIEKLRTLVNELDEWEDE